MQHVCTVSGKEFTVTDDDLRFYEKMGVPIPTLCPEERQRRRLAIENERKLYYRKCDATGENMLSLYHQNHPFPVYHPKYWFSDHWNPKDYGRDFDFHRPFFEQFQELMNKVPKLGLIWLGGSQTMENSEYNNDCHKLKDCYLIFDGEQSRDCLYGQTFIQAESCVDFLFLYNSSFCYECINCKNGYELFFSTNCQNCQQCWFLRDCIGCKNCFGSSNLFQKEFYIYNKKHTKEEYENFMKEFHSGKHSYIQKLKVSAENFWNSQFVKHIHGHRIENSTGDYLIGAKDSQNCFDCENIRDCKYCVRLCMKENTDSYDCDFWGNNSQLIYESNNSGENVHNNAFVYFASMNASNVWYSQFCLHNVKDLFGCIGLRQSQYCILNKQYSKEEYFKLRAKIVEHMKKTGEWGEFFPIEFSPFAYNETIAQEYYPLSKKEVIDRGYKWRDEGVETRLIASLPAQDIPDNIADIPDSICDEILACEGCKKNYQIQKQELKFYRKMKLPIPHSCPDCRHTERLKLRNPRHLWDRTCDKCSTEIQTTFAPERPEKVYCEKCYLETVN